MEQRIIRWFSKVAARMLKIDESHFAIKEIPTAFNIKEHYFKDNYVALGKGGRFILVGNAWLPANFLYGDGVTSAIEDGNVLYHCFDNEEGVFNSEPLEERRRIRLDEYDVYTAKIEERRDRQLSGIKAEFKTYHVYSRQLFFLQMKKDRHEALNGHGRITLRWMREMIEERRAEESTAQSGNAL